MAGGLAGKGIAEKIDPTVEEAYWRENYVSRPYVTKGSNFDDYGPAYRYGIDNYSKYPGKKFDDVEADLARDWQRAKGKSALAWDNAKHATKRLVAARERHHRARHPRRLGPRREVTLHRSDDGRLDFQPAVFAFVGPGRRHRRAPQTRHRPGIQSP